MANKQYNKDSISILSDLKHIQERPGLYIGEAQTPQHLLIEMIDNA